MQIIYGAVLLVMVVLNLFLAFIIRQIVAITNQQVRRHVTRELESCTAALDGKLAEYQKLEEDLARIRQEIQKAEEIRELPKAPAAVCVKEQKPGNGLFYQSGVAYRSEGALETYRYIRDNMKLDHEAIIRQAVDYGKEYERKSEQTELWKLCCQILEKLSHEEIFRLATQSREKQEEQLEALLTGREKEAMEEIAPSGQIPDFISRMDRLRQYRLLYDPQPRIRSGEKEQEEKAAFGVRYEYDPQIHEGVCVRVGTDMIDYSI